MPVDVALDHDHARAALPQGAREGGSHGLLGAQVEMDAPPVVAVERLEDAGEADPLRRGDRRVLRLDDVGAGHRETGRVEQPIGQALVRRHVDADGRGLGRHRRPDALLVDPVAELDERVAVQADERDVAAHRFVDERLRRRPEGLALGQPDQILELGREVEEEIGVVRRHEVVDQRRRHPARLQADGLLAVLVDAVVLAPRAGGAGLAVADVGSGEVLELERDVLGDVAGPGAVTQAGDEPAAPAEGAGVVLERRQERDERVGEARDLVGREVLQDPEIDQQADDRLARPVVGTAQDAGLEDAQRGQRLGRGGRGRGLGPWPACACRRRFRGLGHAGPPLRWMAASVRRRALVL